MFEFVGADVGGEGGFHLLGLCHGRFELAHESRATVARRGNR